MTRLLLSVGVIAAGQAVWLEMTLLFEALVHRRRPGPVERLATCRPLAVDARGVADEAERWLREQGGEGA